MKYAPVDVCVILTSIFKTGLLCLITNFPMTNYTAAILKRDRCYHRHGNIGKGPKLTMITRFTIIESLQSVYTPYIYMSMSLYSLPELRRLLTIVIRYWFRITSQKTVVSNVIRYITHLIRLLLDTFDLTRLSHWFKRGNFVP